MSSLPFPYRRSIATETKKTLIEFTCFPSLPVELRLMIWEFAIWSLPTQTIKYDAPKSLYYRENKETKTKTNCTIRRRKTPLNPQPRSEPPPFHNLSIFPECWEVLRKEYLPIAIHATPRYGQDWEEPLFGIVNRDPGAFIIMCPWKDRVMVGRRRDGREMREGWVDTQWWDKFEPGGEVAAERIRRHKSWMVPDKPVRKFAWRRNPDVCVSDLMSLALRLREMDGYM